MFIDRSSVVSTGTTALSTPRPGVPQSTSMAWRPAYQPQLPHTTWGSLEALQRGHTLRAAGFRVQFEARRLRLLALEVFFFGTAMVVSALLLDRGVSALEGSPDSSRVGADRTD